MDLHITRLIVERMIGAWNAHDLDTYATFLTEDAIWDDPSMPVPTRGRDAIRRFGHGVLRAFPDHHYTIREPICVSPDGTLCAVPWRIEATFLGPFDPPGFAPTGQKTAFDG